MALTGTGYQGTMPSDIGPRVSGSTVSVADFGAVGDGRTDDTAALQRALNFIRDNGGTLELEAGKTYIISSTIKIANASDFAIDGNGATIKMADGVPVVGGKAMIAFNVVEHFEVYDLIVDGNRDNREPAERYAHNITFSDASDFIFTNVASINGVVDGFYLGATDHADPSTYTMNGQFIDVIADNNYRQGMSIINAENIQVLGGSFTNTNGTGPGAGIDIEPNPGSAEPGVKDVLIQNVTFAGNEGFGIHTVAIGSPTNVTIVDNIFTDNAGGGVRFGQANMLVDNNVFYGFDESIRGIIDVVANPINKDSQITNNLFYDIHTGNPVIYVHSNAGAGTEISNNYFYDYSGAGLDINRSGIITADNVFEPCTKPPQILLRKGK